MVVGDQFQLLMTLVSAFRRRSVRLQEPQETRRCPWFSHLIFLIVKPPGPSTSRSIQIRPQIRDEADVESLPRCYSGQSSFCPPWEVLPLAWFHPLPAAPVVCRAPKVKAGRRSRLSPPPLQALPRPIFAGLISRTLRRRRSGDVLMNPVIKNRSSKAIFKPADL